MTKADRWTPRREAALARKAERGFSPDEIGPAMPNPFVVFSEEPPPTA